MKKSICIFSFLFLLATLDTVQAQDPPCTVQVAGNDFSWSYDDTEPSPITHQIDQPSTDYGFVLDIFTLDNSFNLNINGTDIATQEIQFQSVATTGINIRFADGDEYETDTPLIWTMTGNAANPLIRVTISSTGEISLFGSKTSGGSLFPLELFNGNSLNSVSWNTDSPNTVIVTQTVQGGTAMSGTGYGLDLCPDSDGDGVPDMDDLDDDNDGILNSVECNEQNIVERGDFTNLPPSPGLFNPTQFATVNPNWVFESTNVGNGNQIFWGNITAPFVFGNGIRFQRDGETQSLTQTLNNWFHYNQPSILISKFAANNATAPFFSRASTIVISYDGVEYVRVVTTDGANANATLTYSNGAIGTISEVSVGTIYNNWRIDLPYGIPESGNLRIDFFAGSADSDDFSFGDILVSSCSDTDGDGIPDYLDLDSDNDGCPDAVEGGADITQDQLNPDTSIAGAIDENGIPVIANGGQGVGSSNNPLANACQDSDGDSVLDIDDLDDDNDGILDSDEMECLFMTSIIPTGAGNVNTYTLPGADFTATFKVSPGTAHVYTISPVIFGYSGQAVAQDNNGSTISIEFNRPVYNLDLFIDDVDLSSESATLYIYDADGNLLIGSGVSDYVTHQGTQFTVSYPSDRSVVTAGNGDGAAGLPAALRLTFPAYIGISRIEYSQTRTGSGTSGSYNGLAIMSGCVDLDTDEDGIWDRMDLDSDNDGCPDAVEGDENVHISHLNPDGSINIAGNGGIDANGVPNLVNPGGDADVDGNQGQGVGDAYNSSISSACHCVKPGASGIPLASAVGILTKSSVPSIDGWPEIVPNGYLVLDAAQKGMVITHMTTAQIEALEPVEGMLVYDTDEQCVKLYRGDAPAIDPARSGWVCIQRGCNE